MLSKQLMELLFEPFLILLAVMGASTVLTGSLQLEDAVRFAISLWVTALMYRMMLLQIPLAIALKFLISAKWQLSASKAALINFVSLLGALLVFDFAVGGAGTFFKGEASLIPFSIFGASTGAPFLVDLIRKREAYQ